MMIRIVLFDEKTGIPAKDNAARNLNRTVTKHMDCIVTAGHRVPRRRKLLLKRWATTAIMSSFVDRIADRKWGNDGN